MPRIEPDRAALAVAHQQLRAKGTLDQMLAIPSLKIVLEIVARNHMRRRAQVDVKKLQANDHD